MPVDKKSNVLRALEFAPIWLALIIGRILPFWLRGKMFGFFGKAVAKYVPKARDRIRNGLNIVYPNLSKEEIDSIIKEVGRNTALTLSELLMNNDYKRRSNLISADGKGFKVLKQAKANRQGAIIVSAHFGQWEAIRHHLADNNMETGALYRKNNNPFYERLFLKSIKYGGLPIIARGDKGNISMIRHLKKGGFLALLVDQDSHSGKPIKFLGQVARTTTGPAELALRYNLPLVPVFAVRQLNGRNIKLEYEEPIKHTDPIKMTSEINNRISKRIHQNPEQWYWFHNRWKVNPG